MRVALCAATYRRPEGLGRLLDALAALELPGIDLQPLVVIVDNSATADARAQVAAAAPSFPWPLPYLSEPRRGITFARNAATEQAPATDCAFVAFTDDAAVQATN